MLREDALDYYYDNVNDKGFSFEIMCHMIKSHFETEEHKQGMMTKAWEGRETVRREIVRV